MGSAGRAPRIQFSSVSRPAAYAYQVSTVTGYRSNSEQ